MGDPWDGDARSSHERMIPHYWCESKVGDQRGREAISPLWDLQMKVNTPIDDDLIDRTLDIWQPRVRQPLSRDDAVQIINNVSGFFELLAAWAATEQSTNTLADATQHSGPTTADPHVKSQ